MALDIYNADTLGYQRTFTPASDYSAFGATSLAGGFLGSAFGALSAYQAGEAQKDAMDFAAAVARYQAREALKKGDYEAYRYGLGARQLLGSQRAALAAQGENLSSDTALRTQTDTAYMASLDRQMILHNASLEAWGYKVAATGAKIQGQQAETAGIGRAGATLLTGLGDTAYSYFKLQSAGVFGKG